MTMPVVLNPALRKAHT